MTNGQVMSILIGEAIEYRKKGILESITRNNHMNDFDPETCHYSEQAAEAILVDYINFMAARVGMDLGLYTKDLYGKAPNLG
jgi:hypothetical protein